MFDCSCAPSGTVTRVLDSSMVTKTHFLREGKNKLHSKLHRLSVSEQVSSISSPWLPLLPRGEQRVQRAAHAAGQPLWLGLGLGLGLGPGL